MAATDDIAELRSPLDKPLHLLTEDDISQVTREDCRRYLKSKGMRRPSWNKSQAIQQVISLKTLLETSPDSASASGDDGEGAAPTPPPKKLYSPHRVAVGASASAKATAAAAAVSLSAEETTAYWRRDPEASNVFPSDSSARVAAADNDSISPSNPGTAGTPMGQMTIFYCGMVNVYDDVPSDKARVLMQMASNPLHSPKETQVDGGTTCRANSCQIQAASARVTPVSPIAIYQPVQTVRTAENSSLPRDDNNFSHEDNLEVVPTRRKASVQRYLEKRKDRYKSKRKVDIPASSSLDIYMNHQMGDQTPNELSSQHDACSPSRPRPPQTPTRCSSVENLAKQGTACPDQ